MQPFDELEWIMHFFNNGLDLNIEGINRVRNYVFLWNIFETYACNKGANIATIDQAVETINGREPITLDEFAPYVDYFANRYFNPNGDRTYTIDGLKFRNGSGEPAARTLVEQVLNRVELQPKEILKALLFILYRLRNNLFHGEKQVITLDTQIDNFIAANNILSIVLDKMKRQHMIID